MKIFPIGINFSCRLNDNSKKLISKVVKLGVKPNTLRTCCEVDFELLRINVFDRKTYINKLRLESTPMVSSSSCSFVRC